MCVCSSTCVLLCTISEESRFNTHMYITSSETIRQGFIISDSAYPLLVNHIFSKVDIDTYEDFEYAEYLYNKHKIILQHQPVSDVIIYKRILKPKLS